MSEPGVLSLLPAIVAIVLALWTRHVVLSLGVSIWLGAAMLQGWDPLAALYYCVDPLIIDAIADADHVKVTLFSMFVAGTVAIMSKGGGTQALVGQLLKLAKTRRSGMVATWLAGMLVFFDDYANCLIVGSGMRPLADRLKISREKLAYIVDSTAAPLASIALISTWVGYEVGLMEDGLRAAGSTQDAYAFFVEGIGYRSYCIFTLFFVGAVAILDRDFGPMRAAEADPQIPAGDDHVDVGEGGAARLLLGVLPLVLLIGVTFASLWSQGTEAVSAAAIEALPAGLSAGEQAAAGVSAVRDAALFEIIGSADGYDAMLQASLASLLAAGLLAIAARALSWRAAIDAGMEGAFGLTEVLAILFLAWALGSVMKDLSAADYLISALQGGLPPSALPTLVFVVAAGASFATGTSFGTMAILVPLVIPLSFALSGDHSLHLAASGAVLAGACWGDHCSPISDTTVLSSAGTGCDHVSHVKTQLPYALVSGGIAIAFGTLPSGFGISPWLTVPTGIAACFAAVWLLGKPARGRAP